MNRNSNNSQLDLNLEFQTTSKWLQIIPLKLPALLLQIWRSHFMNSLSCLKFLNWKYFKWNSNHFQTPFHFFKWKKSYYLHSRDLWWNGLEFREIKMQDEKFWESPFIPSHATFKSFNFHSISHNQSHNNQTNNHNNLFNITFQNLEFWDVTNYHP